MVYGCYHGKNHHYSPPFGRIFLELFPSSLLLWCIPPTTSSSRSTGACLQRLFALDDMPLGIRNSCKACKKAVANMSCSKSICKYASLQTSEEEVVSCTLPETNNLPLNISHPKRNFALSFRKGITSRGRPKLAHQISKKNEIVEKSLTFWARHFHSTRNSALWASASAHLSEDESHRNSWNKKSNPNFAQDKTSLFKI